MLGGFNAWMDSIPGWIRCGVDPMIGWIQCWVDSMPGGFDAPAKSKAILIGLTGFKRFEYFSWPFDLFA